MPSATFLATASPSPSVNTLVDTSVDLPARARAARGFIGWPSLAETILAIAAIAVIFPRFAGLGVDEAGRDRRFADTGSIAPIAPPATAHCNMAKDRKRLRKTHGRHRALRDLQAQPREGADDRPPPGAVDSGVPAAPGVALVRAKNAAMRDLLATAGWQWGAWMFAGLVLVKLSRTRLPAAVGVSFALAIWAAAAWAGRVPWPLAHNRAFETGRLDARWDAMPASFVIALLVAAGVLLALAPVAAQAEGPGAANALVAIGLPGFRRRHRNRLAASAGPVGQRQSEQPLSGAVSPRPSVACDARVDGGGVPSSCRRPHARLALVGRGRARWPRRPSAWPAARAGRGGARHARHRGWASARCSREFGR